MKSSVYGQVSYGCALRGKSTHEKPCVDGSVAVNYSALLVNNDATL